jgi:rhodanese-related sulfurtransferase
VLCGLFCGVAGSAGASRFVVQDDELASPTLRIAWPEFKKLYDENKAVVVDVRGGDAYAAGHIPGARSIPLDDIARHARELKKLKKPIIVYCA